MADRRTARDHAMPARLPTGTYRALRGWVLDSPAELTSLRHGVVDAVTGHAGSAPVSARLCDAIALVVSELATNALRHAGPPAVVELRTDATSYLLDVADSAVNAGPVLAGIRRAGEGGFGLQIAHQLAQEVGWYAGATTKHVWARFPAA
ncbi:ATP-binding protein [Cellulomonas sp. NS3]|uniref:ATP-binding protein n=1 Tax=Cellulomonas sp. NS3 TaxID=2973977 RepID=UPI0021625D40|nr:ATP-binding protein [Cellulomonas sp. NS3]